MYYNPELITVPITAILNYNTLYSVYVWMKIYVCVINNYKDDTINDINKYWMMWYGWWYV
jgi:hypothetical protein